MSEERITGSESASPLPRTALAVLALVTALGLAARLWGVGYMLPVEFLGDGRVPLAQVRRLREQPSEPTHPSNLTFYPYLMARAVALLPAPAEPGDGVPRDREKSLELAASRSREIRLVSVLLSMLAVPATWLLARRFLGDAWAVLAAAMVATSLLHADLSSQERPHGMVATALLLALLAALRLRRRADASSYLLAGLAAGVAAGALQSGLAALPAFAAAIALQDRGSRRASRGASHGASHGASRQASRWWLLAGLAVFAALVRWLYPFHFEGASGFVEQASTGAPGEVTIGGHIVSLSKWSGLGFRRHLEALWANDPALLLSGLAGGVALGLRWRKRAEPFDRNAARQALVVLGFAVPYFLVTGAYHRTLERFTLPLVPVLACVAGYGLKRGGEAVARGSRLRAAGPALALAVPALAALPAIQLARLHAAPGTNEIAARWILEHVRPDEGIVVLPYLDLPLFHDAESIRENGKTPWLSHWLRHQQRMQPAEFAGPRYRIRVVPPPREGQPPLEEDPLAYFAGQGARFVAIGVSEEPGPVVARAREALRREARLVFRASPLRVPDDEGAVFLTRRGEQYSPSPLLGRPYALELFDVERMGWTIEIWRLGP